MVISLVPGGTERLVVELVRRSRQRVESAVCCLEVAGEWGERLRSEETAVEVLARRPGFRPALGLAIAGMAARFGADVIHCHQYSPFVYGCISQLRYSRARLVFTEHGRLADSPPSLKRRTANAILALMPDRVFTVSDDLRHHLVSEGFRRSRVDVVYNGIDPGPLPSPDDRARARARLGIPLDHFVLGTIARLDPVKDLPTMIHATALLPADPPPRLLIIGDGPERAALEHAASSLSDRVMFVGHRDDARELVPACDLFVNSSVFEGVSLTILEAMAATLPVVATSVGGTPEIVTADTGVLVPARDADALSRAVLSLMNDSRRRETMGRAGRLAVASRFTLDRMVDDYVRVYTGAA